MILSEFLKMNPEVPNDVHFFKKLMLRKKLKNIAMSRHKCLFWGLKNSNAETPKFRRALLVQLFKLRVEEKHWVFKEKKFCSME